MVVYTLRFEECVSAPKAPPKSATGKYVHICIKNYYCFFYYSSQAYIFGCVSISTIDLVPQALLLLKFLQKKSWYFSLQVKSAIIKYSKSQACVFHGTMF